ncbi:hypothetical protein E2562_000038 [Oryza meyeriana var. granulata]|uniref:Uncharacterized protein n=1 Tax=Oryza meyeriana var. granulata TaxID=110450 RepID=A0A6G1DB95_9ORYZ|nr:hypothetical protein E2562_000038 [Oryza meyeriana var. granulata]
MDRATHQPWQRAAHRQPLPVGPRHTTASALGCGHRAMARSGAPFHTAASALSATMSGITNKKFAELA